MNMVNTHIGGIILKEHNSHIHIINFQKKTKQNQNKTKKKIFH